MYTGEADTTRLEHDHDSGLDSDVLGNLHTHVLRPGGEDVAAEGATHVG
jgi:hypothetical protein